ncbi:MAG: hypothetical protein ACO3A2_06630 [Bdellovibrionia bacterium]
MGLTQACLAINLILQSLLICLLQPNWAYGLGPSQPSFQQGSKTDSPPNLHRFLELAETEGFRIQPEIRSNIRFNEKGEAFPILANLANADPLDRCPLDRLSSDITDLVNQLTQKVRASVSKLKSTQGSRCTSYVNHLKASQAQLTDPAQNQFITMANIASQLPYPQSVINAETQRAIATQSILMTVADLIEADCVNSIDDRIVIQRLTGQIITLGGLFWGGWQGMLIALGGQFIGSVPIFQSEVDRALKIFQDYDSKIEKSSFLCLYREMQKTSCSLFARPEEQTIGGLDLTFKSGPAATTLESLDEFKKNFPDLYSDTLTLYEIYNQFKSILVQMNTELFSDTAGHPMALESFKMLRQLTSIFIPEELKNEDEHPYPIRLSVAYLIKTSRELQAFQWHASHPSEFQIKVEDLYFHILAISNYYDQIRRSRSQLGEIARTYESLQFFNRLKTTLDHFKDPIQGNQARLHFLKLTDRLGKTLAFRSFKNLFQDHLKILKISRVLPSFFVSNPHSRSVRSRALSALLDLCQTLDPTLACLSVGDPSHIRLHQQWIKSCVGPKSLLCSGILGQQEGGISLQSILISDPSYQTYFNSLCGSPSSAR